VDGVGLWLLANNFAKIKKMKLSFGKPIQKDYSEFLKIYRRFYLDPKQVGNQKYRKKMENKGF